MVKLKKLLSESSKNRRSRRNVLNIQIAILGWLVEVLGFLVSALGVFILGHENATITMTLQTFSMIFYAILVPCTILINSSDIKDHVVESQSYFVFLNFFGCHPIQYSSSTHETEKCSNDIKTTDDEPNDNLNMSKDCSETTPTQTCNPSPQDSKERYVKLQGSERKFDQSIPATHPLQQIQRHRNQPLQDVQIIDLENNY